MTARVSQTAAPGKRLEDGEPDDQQEVVVRRRNRRREEVDQPNGDEGEYESGRIGSHPGRQRPRSRRPARGQPAKDRGSKGHHLVSQNNSEREFKREAEGMRTILQESGRESR